MAIIQVLRSLLFHLVFFSQTFVLAILIGTLEISGCGRKHLGWVLARYWCRSTIWLLHWIAGVKTRVTGEENIPVGGCIIASKHQSNWDAFAIFSYVGRPSYIAKKELMRIPFFGWAARALNCIEIDRERGRIAIPAMMREAKEAVAEGRRIVIYPEGTRTGPFAPAKYRKGIVHMYTELGVPVVPVALNSGLFWGRNSFVIWPGTAEAKFLPPIEPGLSASEFLVRLSTDIESASNLLMLKAFDNGLSRPMSKEMREQMDVLKR